MLDLDYAGLQARPIGYDPFPHLIVSHFVPPVELERVLAGLPVVDRGGSFPSSSLAFNGAAAELMDELGGQRFRNAIEGRLELDLRDAPTMVTLRGMSREKDGRIHCDSAAKRVTILLYLNSGGNGWESREGCLRLLRSPHDLEDFAVEVPPVDGTLLVFPNGPRTWHGHKRFVGRRYVVQLNYMASDRAARSELHRHRVSAMLKRLVAA